MNRPIHIVMTPTRNEAWVIRAFLECNGLWADYIIIADQMSTDGSRDIINAYREKWKEEGRACKIIMIENNREDIHMAAVRSMLMEEARKIPGDKILVALDADEFWADDFMQTDGWKKMINSKPDDVFEFKRMNLFPDLKHYCIEPEKEYYNWATHVSDDFWEGTYPTDRFIHEWRLKWSKQSTDNKVYQLDDLKLLHLCFVSKRREENKKRFYMVSSVAVPNNVYNMINLYRLYNHLQNEQNIHETKNDVFEQYQKCGIDISGLIDTTDEGAYYIERILYYIQRDGAKKYAILDIWNQNLCEKYGLRDPRNIWQKAVHFYLRKTNNIASTNKIIKAIDKVLKKVC